MDSRLTIMENCLDRLDAVFAERPLPMEGTKVLPETAEHEIQFDHVTFAYGDNTILHDVTFTADKGQMIALVGESGSGKTTIANLLARFWDMQEGSVRLRGVNIKELPMETLLEANPSLKGLADPDNGTMTVFFFGSGTATIYSFTEEPKVIQISS